MLVTLAVTLLLKNDNVSVEPQLAYSFIPQHTQPHLILADGEVIRLDSVKKAVATKDGSVVYGKNGTGIYYDSLQRKTIGKECGTLWWYLGEESIISA